MPDGRMYRCADCCRAYRKANASRIAARNRQYKQANPAVIKKNRRHHYEHHAEVIRERARKYRNDNPHKLRDSMYRFRYGISLAEYEALVDKQSGKCAICRLPPPPPYKRLSVDHCHETDAIRGLLCPHCNAALGLVKDNITTLQVMITYLRGSGHK